MFDYTDTVSLIVWAIFLGIVFAMIYITNQRNAVGKFISGLSGKNINSKESAKTLDELGIKGAFLQHFILSDFKGQYGLSKLVMTVQGERKSDDPFEKKSADRYYLPSENAEGAVRKYVSKHTSAAKLALSILILFVVALLATTVIKLLTSYASRVFIEGDKAPYESASDKNDGEDSESKDEESGTEDPAEEENAGGNSADNASDQENENTDAPDDGEISAPSIPTPESN